MYRKRRWLVKRDGWNSTDDSMLGIMLEKFEALQADNAEIKARLTAIESGSPKSTHRASVELPDGGTVASQPHTTPQYLDHIKSI